MSRVFTAPHPLVVALPIAASFTLCLPAQSSPPHHLEWEQKTPAAAGFFGPLLAPLDWDPDGPGPAESLVVVGGQFRRGQFDGVNDRVFGHVAAWDPRSGSILDLGGGVDGPVTAMATLATHELVVAGDFTTAGGVPARGIAAFDGQNWRALGTGPDQRIETLLLLQNGDLIAGGSFLLAGGTTARGVARWDGTAWSEFATGVDGRVTALGELQNGDVIVGGDLQVPGTTIHNVARWDGAQWHGYRFPAHPVGIPAIEVVGPDTFLVAHSSELVPPPRWPPPYYGPGLVVCAPGGFFYAPYDLYDLFVQVQSMRWDPAAMALDVSGYALEYAGFHDASAARITNLDLTGQGLPAPPVLEPLADGGISGFLRLPAAGGQEVLVATGFFSAMSGQTRPGVTAADLTLANSIAVRDADRGWRALGPERGETFDGSISDVLRTRSGDLILGGDFERIGGRPTGSLVRLVEGRFEPITGWTGEDVQSLAEYPNGDLLVHGSRAFARYDGTNWTTLPTPQVTIYSPRVSALTESGTLYGTDYGIFRLDVGAWVALPNPGTNSIPSALATIGEDLYVCYGSTGTPVYRWDGLQWTSLGLPPNGTAAYNLQVLSDGRLFVICNDGLAIHDSSAWQAITTAGQLRLPYPVVAKALPDGDLLVASPQLKLPGLEGGLYRFDGSTWSEFGPRMTAIEPVGNTGGIVRRFGDLESDGLDLFGYLNPEDVAPAAIARVRTSFPVESLRLPVTCNSARPDLMLTLEGAPWSGSQMSSQLDGLVPGSLGALAFGARSPNLPLPFPGAGPGCLLLTDPDIIVGVSSGGRRSYRIPDLPSIVGQSFFHQGFELDLSIGTVRASDAFRFTIGRF